jgi:hypothetical protein
MHSSFAIADAIIDLLLVDPALTKNDIAIRLELHPATVAMLMNSDLFRARYEQRRGAQRAALTQEINARLSRVALQALELTEEILAQERTAIPLPQLVDVADKTLARLGYGPKMAANPAVVIINDKTSVVAPVTPEQLQAARQKLIEAQAHASAAAGGGLSSSGASENASRLPAGERETLLSEGGERKASGDS